MELVNKIRNISAKECMQLKRLPYDLLIGHCSYVFDKAGVPHVNPIPEEYFDAVIDGIIDEIYGGVEPEFNTEEEYNRYEAAIEKLKKCEYSVEEYIERIDYCNSKYKVNITGYSPYQDKTIPFLTLKKK